MVICCLKSIGPSSRFEYRVQFSVFLKPSGGPLPNNIATDGNRNIFQLCRYAGQFNVTKQPCILGGFSRFWNVLRDSPFLNDHSFVSYSRKFKMFIHFFVLILVIKLTTIKYIQPSMVYIKYSIKNMLFYKVLKLYSTQSGLVGTPTR